MKSKTKEELIKLVQELQEKCERLENDVDYWQDEYNDMEEQRDDLDCRLKDAEMKGGINDLDNFIWELKKDGIYSDSLQSFINHYLKYHND